MIEIQNRHLRIIASKLEGAQITPATRFDAADLGADLFGLMEVIVSFEDAFSIAISNAAMERLRTVGDLIAQIRGSLH